MTILTVGIDLAKNVFALHGVNEAGKPELLRPSLPRAKLNPLSGFDVPSKANEAAFNLAVEQVAASARQIIGTRVTSAEPRDRAIESGRRRVGSPLPPAPSRQLMEAPNDAPPASHRCRACANPVECAS